MPSINPKTEALVKMWHKASTKERAFLGGMHAHYEQELRRMKDAQEEPQNVAYTVHGIIDDGVQDTIAQSSHRVSCAKGCSHCCRLFVNVTHEEAVLLLVHAEDAGIAIDWEKAERQARAAFPQWSSLTASDRRCVFLAEDGACAVYEHRPTSCRKYMVVGNPDHCDTVKHPKHDVAILASPVAEVVASAALCVQDSGSLPRMLLEAKQ